MQKIKVLIADDQVLFSESLKTVLSLKADDINVMETLHTGKEVIHYLENGNIPDIILLDVRMPEMDGIEVAKIVSSKYPNIKILMLTTFNDDDYVQQALKNNVIGYVLKDIEIDSLINIIYSAVRQNIVQLSQEVVKKLLEKETEPTESDEKMLSQLSPREREVFYLISIGLENEEIEKKLNISGQTVKNYVSLIYQKLDIHTRLQAIKLGKKIHY